MRGWFDTRGVDALAAWAAAEMARSLPLGLVSSASAEDLADRLGRWETRLARHLEEQPLPGGLNAFKKARLGAQLQLALTRAGYARPLARRCALTLLHRMAR